ncbi:alkaline phosphatase D family protein [Rhabdobacter roseus]|uniref:Alkaline phosphatase D n=1 Tax=Rhabdobacter roseus TaxID=1655419 RepID=A0A840TP29_9BACT|nr:alkaline phosphatase D family protein [Rhabdobacter roseus]MBB5285491.1 alkaline phosphatase D [Rhabdobacter roseus]
MNKDSRRSFFKKSGLSLVSFSLLDLRTRFFWPQGRKSKGVPAAIYFTTGCKVAEVTSHSAVLWTRLCAQEKPNPITHKRVETVFRHPIDFDEHQPVQYMDGAVKGVAGWVRATLTARESTLRSDWFPALPEHDFTVQIPFSTLQPATTYQIKWEAKPTEDGLIFVNTGTFQTAPEAHTEKAVQLVTSTCQYFWSYDDDQRGFKTYDSMRRLNPDFFVHTGDYVYYDKPGPLATTPEKARHQWHAMDSWPSLVDFYKSTPAYLLKDDHDLLRDDAYPSSAAYGELTFQDGLKIWRENAPLQGTPYRTFRWGQDLQLWLVEGREFRSPNTLPDSPDKTIWGSAQKQWFTRSVEASDATFKILFSPTPVVGPDRDKKTDNHANKAFQSEGTWLRNYLSRQKNMFVVNGDRHWQYVSVDKPTGLLEFGSGPVSDAHAQGWNPDEVREEHRFLRVKGGFLGIQVAREGPKPRITFTHYDVDGKPVHEESRVAE